MVDRSLRPWWWWWTLIAASIALLAQPAYAARKPFNFTLDVLSPMMQYTGPQDNYYDSLATWQGDGTPTVGTPYLEVGNHTINIGFMCTGISFQGNASGTTSMAVTWGSWWHSTNTSRNSTVIAAAEGPLTYGYYDMAVFNDDVDGLPRNLSVSMSQAVIATALDTQFDSFDASPNQTEVLVDSLGNRSPFFYVEGTWTYNGSIGGTTNNPANNIIGRAYPHMVGSGDAYLNFNVPDNTSFMVINGTVGSLGGLYNVTTNPALSGSTVDYTLGTSEIPNPVTYNSNSRWESEAVLFAAPLDPTVQYEVIVDNGGGDGSIGFYGATFWFATQPNNSTTTQTPTPGHPGAPKNHTGAIIGGVIGGVAFVVLVALAAYFLGRRRRAAHPAATAAPDMTSGETGRAPLTSAPTAAGLVASSTQRTTPASSNPYLSSTAADSKEATPDIVSRKLDLLRRDHESQPPSPVDGGLATSGATTPLVGAGAASAASAVLTARALREHRDRIDRIDRDTPLSAVERPDDASTALLPPLHAQPPLQMPLHQQQFTQASDAGRIDSAALEIIPPSYDPAWAPSPTASSGVSPVDSVHTHPIVAMAAPGAYAPEEAVSPVSPVADAGRGAGQ